MSTNSESSPQPTPLAELLNQRDEKLRKLYIKVMNLHAGHQMGPPRSPQQLVAEVRKEVEQSLP